MTSIKNGIGVGATAIIVCERLSSNIIGLLGGNFCKNVGYFENAETRYRKTPVISIGLMILYGFASRFQNVKRRFS
jgi:hypothetical protein